MSDARRPYLLAAILAFATAIASGCGGGATEEAPPETAEFAPGYGPGPGGGSVQFPTYAGLREYGRRCEEINQRGAEAQVVYEASKEMKLGDSSEVSAAVTLDQSAPPEKVLPRTDAVGEPGLVVSCRLQARLTASKYEFDIDDSGWIDRSVYAMDTARWVWIVTPKLGGDHTLTLFVRPIVSQELTGADSETSQAAEANIRDYTTRVHVDVPWNKRPEELMTQIASTLNVAENLITALTAVIVAVIAFFAALPRLRKWRRKRAG